MSTVRRIVAGTSRPLRRQGRRLAAAAVRAAARRGPSRRAMQALYRVAPAASRGYLHAQFAEAFDVHRDRPWSGEWTVEFAGRPVRIPVREETFALDWGVGLALLGHDAAVKTTYGALMRSEDRPEVFVDIGANIGTHLALFAAHAVPVIAFEPNSECRAYVRGWCDANQWRPRVEPIALGEERGSVSLHYPKGSTWLGSTDPGVISRLQERGPLVAETVALARLDDFASGLPPGRMLIKIDTEGHERAVVRGGRQVLRERRPLVVFECWRDAHRHELFAEFAALDYTLAALPWQPGETARLSAEAFVNSLDENFIAIPIGSYSTHNHRPSTDG